MAHQAVEVERRRGAGVDLDVAHLGQRHHRRGQRAGHPGGLLQGRALGHVDHHLHLALVVEGEHLDGDDAEVDQRHRGEEQHRHRREQRPAPPGPGQQRPEEARVDAVEAGLPRRLVVRLVAGLVRRGRRLLGMAAEQAIGQPGRDHERHQQREHHRRRGVDRDRPHVGPHQPGDEGQRQERRHHREGGEDGRVADLVGGVDGGLAGVGPGELVVAVDVLHHHDGVVDQDADGEDEGEQGDPVEGVAEEVGGGQGQRQGGGHRHQHHHRLAPAEGERHQQHDGEGGDPQVLHQLRRFFVGGEAVVAGLGDLDVGRDHRAAQAGDPAVEVGDQGDGVGARLLGHRQGHRRRLEVGRQVLLGAGGAGQHPGVGGRLVGAVGHRRHVAQVDRDVRRRPPPPPRPPRGRRRRGRPPRPRSRGRRRRSSPPAAAG